MSVAERQRPDPGDLCLDHLGHFVPDLDAAARLLDKLGLSSTTVSHHRISGKPAGTSNRCVMLEQGYLEILCPTLDTPHAQRVRGLMARYDGVHLACFGTPDAGFEHQRLGAHGFDSEIVDLGRSLDSGEELRFKVVYVPPERMPEGRVQYCEHLTPEHLWKPQYVNALRLEEIYVVADDPVETAARWARFSGLLPRPEGKMVALETARGKVLVGKRKILSGFLEAVPPAPGIAAYRMGCDDPDRILGSCSKAGLALRKCKGGHAVALPRALGGTWLLA